MAVVVLATGGLTSGAAPPRPPLERYKQTLTIHFADADSAAAARVVILPVWGGRLAAFTCRWDDNSFPTNLEARDVMEAHGLAGTFYLSGPESAADREALTSASIHLLLTGGNSLGSHGWSHAPISSLSPAGMFRELARARVELEALADVPVRSHAWAFDDFGRGWAGGDTRDAAADSVVRAGFLHQTASDHPTLSSTLASSGPGWRQLENGIVARSELARWLPPEGPWHGAAQLLLDRRPNAEPVVHLGMHSREEVASPERRAALERSMLRAGGSPLLWYCSAAEWAAYRAQVRNAEIEPSVEGKVLNVVVTRPVLVDLDHPVPLTFAVENAPAMAVEDVVCPTAAVERRDRGSTVRFDLHHDRDQQLPASIEHVHRRRAPTTGGPGPSQLGGRAWIEGPALHWVLSNPGPRAVTGLRASIRVPPPFEPGVVHQRPPSTVPPGHHVERVLHLRGPRPGSEHYFVVQVDMRVGGVQTRLFLTTEGPPGGPCNPSRPSGGFERLGPVPGALMDGSDLEALAAGTADRLVLADGTVRSFVSEPPADTATEVVAHLSSELIPTAGTWRTDHYPERSGLYLLRSEVITRQARRALLMVARASVRRVFLNHVEVVSTDMKASRRLVAVPVELRAGANDILVVATTVGAPPADRAGAFLRLADPESGEPLQSVVYRPPG